MSDPLQPVTRGQPIPTGAATWNAILDAARARRGGKLPGVGAGPLLADLTPSVTVLVRNDTGGTLTWPGVLALGDSIVSAADHPHDVQRRPLFEGTTPAAATDPFALMTEPLASGKIGVGVVQGVAVCEVSVSDTAHEYAEPIAGNSLRLASAASGPARILDIEAGTGNKRAVVLISQGAGNNGGGGGGSGGAVGGCGWLAELENIPGLWLQVISAEGMCSCIDDAQMLFLTPDGSGGWAADPDLNDPSVFSACTGDFVVRFVANGCEPPCLSLTVSGSGPTEYKLYFDYCEPAANAIVFAGSGPVFCDGDLVPNCANNRFQLRLVCAKSFCEPSACPGLPAVLYATITECACDCITTGVPIPLYPGAGGFGWVSETDDCPGWPGNGIQPAGFGIELDCIDADGEFSFRIYWAAPGEFAAMTKIANVNVSPNTCDPFYLEFYPDADPFFSPAGVSCSTLPMKVVITA